MSATAAMDWAAQAGAIMLTRSDVAALLSLPDCIAAVESALRMHAEGVALSSRSLSVEVRGGGYHVKTSGLLGERPCFAAKINANFPGNRAAHGLPTIQGVVVLFDGANGRPLAIMDSGEITRLRTAAATAVAARYLARPDSSVATIIGCGVQGQAHLEALRCVLKLRTVHAIDRARDIAERFARENAAALGLDVRPAQDIRAAVRGSDICVTCTTSQTPVLRKDDVPAGAFVAAVGADNPHKQELEPALLAANTVVVDALDQCADMGELRHALAAGVMQSSQVHAELAEIVAGRRPGRTSREEIIVFDSVGIALEDAAASVAAFERAVVSGDRKSVRLAE